MNNIAHANHLLEQQFAITPIIPVLKVDDLEQIKKQVQQLVEYGCINIEITLRTSLGLKAIEMLANEPNIHVGAGTVKNYQQCIDAYNSGAKFIVSPGVSTGILKGIEETQCAFLGGVATLSEAMQLHEFGCNFMKFFPAQASGGTSILKSWLEPMPHLKFCPTGGVNSGNYQDYLNLDNVVCVGSSKPLELMQ